MASDSFKNIHCTVCTVNFFLYKLNVHFFNKWNKKMIKSWGKKVT